MPPLSKKRHSRQQAGGYLSIFNSLCRFLKASVSKSKIPLLKPLFLQFFLFLHQFPLHSPYFPSLFLPSPYVSNCILISLQYPLPLILIQTISILSPKALLFYQYPSPPNFPQFYKHPNFSFFIFLFSSISFSTGNITRIQVYHIFI